MTLDCTI